MARLRELSRWTTTQGGLVRICAGSIVDFKGDAVVNAANVGGIGGGGIDGAVNHAGGTALLNARINLPQVEPGVRIPTGESRITVAGDLDVRFVIHSVGPCYPLARDEDHQEEDLQLKAAYMSALGLAHKHELRHVAFALISAGVFRGARTLQEILSVSCQAIDDSARAGDDLSLCAYADEEQDVLQTVAASVFVRDKRKMSRTGPAPSSPAGKPAEESADEPDAADAAAAQMSATSLASQDAASDAVSHSASASNSEGASPEAADSADSTKS